jgi:hypothetical protein
MHLPEQRTTQLSFIPARLTEGKVWFISFYAFDPVIQKLQRKKIRLNRIRSISSRRSVGRKMVAEINAKLFNGWNPFLELEAPKAFHKLLDVLDSYMVIQSKELEANTIRCYNSFVAKLKEYVENTMKQSDMYVYQFTDRVAAELMLHINSLPKVSVRTYNGSHDIVVGKGI